MLFKGVSIIYINKSTHGGNLHTFKFNGGVIPSNIWNIIEEGDYNSGVDQDIIRLKTNRLRHNELLKYKKYTANIKCL